MTLFSTPGDAPGQVIPVLTARVPVSDIAPDMRAAFDRLQSEKTRFFELADAIHESLRPELERLAAEVVQRTLRDVWVQRTGIAAKSPRPPC